MSIESIDSYGYLEAARRYLPARLLSRNAPVISRGDTDPIALSQLISNGATVDRESIRVHGRSIQAYQITPPQEVEHQGRIFVANGWRSSVAHQHEYLQRLTAAGFTITSFDNNFTQRNTAEAHEAANKLQGEGRTYTIEYVKADAVKETFTTFPRLPWEETAIVAHSEGSIYGSFAATELQEEVDYLLLINPAVTAKKTSILGITAKAAYESYRNQVAKYESDDTASIIDVVSYVAANPLTGIPELSAAATARDTQRIDDLRANGMLVANVHGARDKLFPYRNMHQHHTLFDVVTLVPDGAHEIVSNPEGYANAVIATHQQLREKRMQRKLAASGVVFGN